MLRGLERLGVAFERSRARGPACCAPVASPGFRSIALPQRPRWPPARSPVWNWMIPSEHVRVGQRRDPVRAPGCAAAVASATASAAPPCRARRSVMWQSASADQASARFGSSSSAGCACRRPSSTACARAGQAGVPALEKLEMGLGVHLASLRASCVASLGVSCTRFRGPPSRPARSAGRARPRAGGRSIGPERLVGVRGDELHADPHAVAHEQRRILRARRRRSVRARSPAATASLPCTSSPTSARSTRSALIRARSEISASVMPSTKYSWAGSCDTLRNGSTASHGCRRARRDPPGPGRGRARPAATRRSVSATCGGRGRAVRRSFSRHARSGGRARRARPAGWTAPTARRCWRWRTSGPGSVLHERPLAGRHLEQRDPQRIDVGAAVFGLPEQLLGRHVGQRSLDRAGPVRRPVTASGDTSTARPKSRILGRPSAVSATLPGLRSRCRNALPVRTLERIGEDGAKFRHARDRQPARGQAGLRVPAGTYSMTRKSSPSRASKSKTVAMPG